MAKTWLRAVSQVTLPPELASGAMSPTRNASRANAGWENGKIQNQPKPSAAQPLNNEDALAAFRGCDRPLTTWSAAQAMAAVSSLSTRASAVVPVSTGSWSLVEDVKGKPGWISNTSGSELFFPLRVGHQPKVVITFLRTYTRPGGSISLSLNGSAKGVPPLTELSGLWDLQ